MMQQISATFTLASGQGLEDLRTVAGASIREIYKTITNPAALDVYIAGYLDRKRLINELNSLANQVILVYVDDRPAGFALLSTGGARPDVVRAKSAVQFVNFNILTSFNEPRVQEALWLKCLSVCKTYGEIWMNALQEDALLPFFEAKGFVRKGVSLRDPFSRPSVLLIRKMQ